MGRRPSQRQRNILAHQTRRLVWFATNRKEEDDLHRGTRFGGSEDPTHKVRYGRCAVVADHRLPTQLSEGDLSIAVRRASSGLDGFRKDLRYYLTSLPDAEPAILIYIHGLGTSFKSSVITAARLAIELGFGGAVGCFSWPSLGHIWDYPHDEQSVTASTAAIAGFLTTARDIQGASDVHVIAHSLGGLGLMRSLSHMVPEGKRFGHLILAAPDIDAVELSIIASQRTLDDQDKRLAKLAKRCTMYVSKQDRAIQVSAKFHRRPRAGYARPITIVPSVDTINASQMRVQGWLGHGYFLDSKYVRRDMKLLIDSGAQPFDRGLFTAQTPQGDTYWLMRPRR